MHESKSPVPPQKLNQNGRFPTWRELNWDTSPGADAYLRQLWREAPAWKKLQMLEYQNRGTRQLALMGLRHQFPNASEAELGWRYKARLLGDDLTREIYGDMPTQGNGR